MKFFEAMAILEEVIADTEPSHVATNTIVLHSCKILHCPDRRGNIPLSRCIYQNPMKLLTDKADIFSYIREGILPLTW